MLTTMTKTEVKEGNSHQQDKRGNDIKITITATKKWL